MKKILLIDDDADDSLLFLEALKELTPEFGFHTAANGEIALRQLAQQEIARPDLIFLDVNMPRMSGWECLAVLKKDGELQHIPVIMYSTSSHPLDVKKASQMGALSFLTKPSNFSSLKKSLELIFLHLNGNTLPVLERVIEEC